MQVTQTAIEEIVTRAFGLPNALDSTYGYIRQIVVDVFPHLPTPLTEIELTFATGAAVAIAPGRGTELFEVEEVAGFSCAPKSTSAVSRPDDVQETTDAGDAEKTPDVDSRKTPARTTLDDSLCTPESADSPHPSVATVTPVGPPSVADAAPAEPAPVDAETATAPVARDITSNATQEDQQDAPDKCAPSIVSNRSTPVTCVSPPPSSLVQFPERKRRRAESDAASDGGREIFLEPFPRPPPSLWLPPFVFCCPSCKKGVALAACPWPPAVPVADATSRVVGSEKEGAEK